MPVVPKKSDAPEPMDAPEPIKSDDDSDADSLDSLLEAMDPWRDED